MFNVQNAQSISKEDLKSFEVKNFWGLLHRVCIEERVSKNGKPYQQFILHMQTITKDGELGKHFPLYCPRWFAVAIAEYLPEEGKRADYIRVTVSPNGKDDKGNNLYRYAAYDRSGKKLA